MSLRIHLMLDLENVQPEAAELEQVRGPHFRLWVAHGPQQKSFTADRAKAWQPLGENVHFIQSTKPGKNALDLHIAFCIGEASEVDRRDRVEGHYIIVSKDKDFDALFGYLDERGVRTARTDTLSEALVISNRLLGMPQPVKPKKVPVVSPSTERILESLRAHPKNRPTTRKRLENHIGSLLGEGRSDQEVARVTRELCALNALGFEGTKVRYVLRAK